MGVEDLEIPMTAVKFYKKEDKIPEAIKENQPTISLTSCQAAKQASLGDAALLTYDNIGCVAAAITFGLVDKDQTEPLGDSKVYTDIMRDQSGLGDDFKPPSPKDFTDGNVYACKDSGRMDFALFGNEDTGRFKDVETAKKAMKDMMGIYTAATEEGGLEQLKRFGETWGKKYSYAVKSLESNWASLSTFSSILKKLEN